ncbi:MAG: ATP-binding cassette domain-containing protein [Magnetococcales bacterium]|nr:ATP-binding cassette domain-containing protein [Magnetococcales bacterium]
MLDLAAVVLPLAWEALPLDLTISKGEVWVIDGPSGAGKTTLFKVMSGLIRPYDGAVFLFGCNLDQTHADQLIPLRRRMGVLLEGNGLIPSWTVFENLALPWRYHGWLSQERLEPHIEAQMLRYQEDMGLLYRVAASLTQEQCLRMALLRAVQKEPELLLLDNDRVAFHLTRILKLAWAEKLEAASVAMVVRGSPHLAASLPAECIRLAVMRQGNLLASGKPAELRHHPDQDVVLFAKRY